MSTLKIIGFCVGWGPIIIAAIFMTGEICSESDDNIWRVIVNGLKTFGGSLLIVIWLVGAVILMCYKGE